MDPALWELLRAEAGTDGDRVIEAIIRLARPGIEIPDVQIVSRFGTVATCRIRARDVVAVRARPEVISVKAARGLSPGFEPAADPASLTAPAWTTEPTDVRRDPGLTLTGAGVVVASVDWGVDVDSAAFRWPAEPGADTDAGGTRFLSFWDQRDQAPGPCPYPYEYGTVHDREEIDDALADPRPYERLGYHPAIADPGGHGAHGTHVLDIAAGNGQAGGPVGIAPGADLVFVHLADRRTGGLANFGDSVRLLEAVDFISRTAGPRPCVINISAGRTCGPKDGTTLVERALDELLAAIPGRFVVNSAGNYFGWRTHSCGRIGPGETRSLTFVVDPADVTLNEIEIWYDGADEFAVRVTPPGYAQGRAVSLGERSDLLAEGRVIGRVYHREHDPNNGDNHVVAYINPVGCPGHWTVTLEARRVTTGRFHAWIERDDSCRGCQARFALEDSRPVTTIGTIASSRLPLIVGAYDGDDPDRPIAPFSSSGPSRDLRQKPDLAAPGVEVLAARSASIVDSHNPGLLVRKSGTSMATPHVTGAVALCLEAAGDRLSAGQIRSLVLGSCDPVPAPDADRLGRGYLNIPRLVAEVQRTLALRRRTGLAPLSAGPALEEENAAPRRFRVADLPATVRQAFARGGAAWREAVQVAISARITDPLTLADLVFFMQHPERIKDNEGKSVEEKEPEFSKLRAEWDLYCTIVTRILKPSAKPTVFLPERQSQNYEDFVAAPTKGLITLMVHGRNWDGLGQPGTYRNALETFDRMQETVESLGAGDSLYIANWQFTPTDLLLTASHPGSPPRTWADLLAAKAREGVKIRVIIALQPIVSPFGTDLTPLDACIAKLPEPVRDNFKYIWSPHSDIAGSHHQKFMVARKGNRAVAFCGGLDISYIRAPGGKPNPQGHPTVYWGPDRVWHDVGLKAEGQIAHDLEREFVMRWNREKGRLRIRLDGWKDLEDLYVGEADRAPERNKHSVQMLRTVSVSPDPPGIRRDDIWRGYFRLIGRATRFIYLENQYFREPKLADAIVRQAESQPGLIVIIMVGTGTDDSENAPWTQAGYALRLEFFQHLCKPPLAPDRLRVYTLNYSKGILHSKLILVDDEALSVGSANANPRGFFFDTEVNVMLDNAEMVKSFRHRLWAHNLGTAPNKVAAWDPAQFFTHWDHVAQCNQDQQPETENMVGEGVIPFKPLDRHDRWYKEGKRGTIDENWL